MSVSTTNEQDAQRAARIIRLWRRVFLAFYLLFLTAAVLGVFFSVCLSQCGGYDLPIKGKQIKSNASDPKELQDCQRRLGRLVESLQMEAGSVLNKANQFDSKPAAEWANWSKNWRFRWRSMAHRCRLEELGGQGKSEAIDRMAGIHQTLGEIHRIYTNVIGDFADRYLARIRQLRAELKSVRAQIGRSWPTKSGAKQ